jgi:hypothetical protein
MVYLTMEHTSLTESFKECYGSKRAEATLEFSHSKTFLAICHKQTGAVGKES